MDTVEPASTAATPGVDRPVSDGAAARSGRGRPAVRAVFVLLGIALLVFGANLLVGWQVRSAAAATLEQAEGFLREGAYGQARDALRWLLWFDPNNDSGHLICGLSFKAEQQRAEAIAHLERVGDGSPRMGEARRALAEALVEDGQFERVEQVLLHTIERSPDDELLHDRLVWLYLKELRVDDARNHLERHWARNPQKLDWLSDLVDLHTQLLNPQLPVALLETADKAHPGQGPVVLGLARAYVLCGRVDEAETRYEEALTLQPDSASVRSLAAEFYLDRGDPQRAAAVLGQSVPPGAERDYRYWLVRGRIAERLESLEAAASHLEKAVALRPDSEQAVLLEAAILRRRGHTEAAARAARKAAQLADDRRQLWLQWQKFDPARPDPDLCARIADRLDALGLAEQARGWRQWRQLALQHAAASPLPAGATPRAESP